MRSSHDTHGGCRHGGVLTNNADEHSHTSVYMDSRVLFSQWGPPGHMAALGPGARGAVRLRSTGAAPPPGPASHTGSPQRPCQLFFLPFSITVSLAGVTTPRFEWDNRYLPKSGVQFHPSLKGFPFPLQISHAHAHARTHTHTLTTLAPVLTHQAHNIAGRQDI